MKNYKVLISRITRVAQMFLLGGMVAMTASCEKFLTIAPTNKIVEEDFWRTKGDVGNVVAESYRLMTTSDFLNRLIVWGELRSDNVIEGNYGGNNEIKYIMEANILPNNSYAQWDVFYKIINNCNIVLECAPRVLDEDPDFTLGDLDVVRGEMYALRALCHFYLVRTFRDVPLQTEAMVNNSQKLKQAQAEPLVVLDSCLNDLYTAEELVLTSGNYPSAMDNKGRVTKDAVRTMIADVLLWKAAFLQSEKKKNEANACYTQCAEYCDRVLNTRMEYIEEHLAVNQKFYENQGMELHETYPILYPRLESTSDNMNRFPFKPYFDSFGSSANSLCESIFEIQHTSTASNANYEVPNFFGYGESEGVFKVGILSAPTDLALEGTSDDSKIYQKSDFRRLTYVYSQKSSSGTAPENYGIIKYSQLSQVEERNSDLANEAFGNIVYRYFDTNTSGGRYIETPVNWVVYRIPDVMLMKAEALAYRAEGNDLADAYSLVEAVYNRSQSKGADGAAGKFLLEFHYPFNNYSNSAGMAQLVLEERQRELAFEGKRWYDLVRKALCDGNTNAMLDIIVPRKYESNPSAYRTKMLDMYSLFFPIAEREINTNDLLEQNPVYKTENVYE